MTLQFESELSGADQSSVAVLQNDEKRKREAMMGPDEENVATGGFVGDGGAALIGARKDTITEQLFRSEGYQESLME
jgi:hypothetical protein